MSPEPDSALATVRSPSTSVRVRLSVLSAALVPLLTDIVLPLTIYYTMRSMGAGPVPALIAGAAPPGARAIGGIIRHRRLDGMATFVLGTVAVALALTLITGSPRFLLVKDGIATGLAALLLFTSAYTARPVMADALRPFIVRSDPGMLSAWNRLVDVSVQFRHNLRQITAAWGIGFIVDSLVRTTIALTLPEDTVVWLNVLPTIATIAVLSWVHRRWVRQLKAMLTQEVGRGA